MLFTLEALQADHGDSLLLHYGDEDDPRLILIDAGPPGAWKKSVKPRLLQLRGEETTGPTIDLLMISHIDDDHVGGVLGLTREMVKAHEEGDEAPYEVLELWHNAFEDLLDDDAAAATIATVTSSPSAAARDSSVLAAALPTVGPGGAVVASVNQGRRLRDDAKKLGIGVNLDFSGLVRRTDPETVRSDAGLDLRVLGPTESRLEDLRRKWDSVAVKKSSATAASWLKLVADFVDQSVFNLSSLVVLAEAAGGTMLLTGDARGDDILDGLREADLLEDGTLHVDLFKVPHHGSDRNVSTDFFRRVTADHYVISANGRDDNPDRPMLKMLSDARGDDEYTVVLTNEVDHAQRFYKRDQPKHEYEVRVREEGMPSILLDLGEPLPSPLEPGEL